MRLNISGGPATMICDVPGGGSGGVWLPDGRVVVGGSALSQGFGLRACKTDGNGAVGRGFASRQVRRRKQPQLSGGAPGRPPRGLYGLPAGRMRDTLGIYVATLGSAERRLLIQDGANAGFSQGYLLFMRGTTLLAQRLDPVTVDDRGRAAPDRSEHHDRRDIRADRRVRRIAGGILAYILWQSELDVAARMVRSNRTEAGSPSANRAITGIHGSRPTTPRSSSSASSAAAESRRLTCGSWIRGVVYRRS